MGLFDDDYDDLYPPEHYPEYDFNRDGHIDWFEAGEIETDEAYGSNWDMVTPVDDSEKELEEEGISMVDFLLMNDAKKYKALDESISIIPCAYAEYFDDFARIDGMDEEIRELDERGIDPYDFDDACDDRKYQILKEAGLEPEDYAEYFEDFEAVNREYYD